MGDALEKKGIGLKICVKAYRYGFNGKEKDQVGEWGLNHYDYGFRIYNPALGRFLSVDPLTRDYPMLTPYQFASNRPIDMIDLDGLEGMHHVHLIETQARSLIKKTGDEEALVRFNESMMKMNNVQLAATAVPVGVALDLYLTRGQVTKALINQAKIQVIANASLEGINLASGETEDISSAFKNTLTKSLKGVDGADAILGVVFKNKSVANVLSSLVDLSINPETRELELKSLVKGKSATDITIDVVLNFVTDRAGDKIKNTKFSGPVKEAAKVAGLDINNFLKDFFKTKGLNTTGDLNIDELKNPTVESDATKVAHPPRFQDK